jgi:hypothetical protein
MPMPASPAPKNRIRWSHRIPPVFRNAEHKPARAAAAVLWIVIWPATVKIEYAND